MRDARLWGEGHLPAAGIHAEERSTWCWSCRPLWGAGGCARRYGVPGTLPILLEAGLPLSWHAQNRRREYSGRWTATVFPALESHPLGTSGSTPVTQTSWDRMTGLFSMPEYSIVPVFLLCHPPGLSGLPRGQGPAQEHHLHPQPVASWARRSAGEFGTGQSGSCADGDTGGEVLAF